MRAGPAVATLTTAVVAVATTEVFGWPVGGGASIVLALVLAQVVVRRRDREVADLARQVRWWRTSETRGGLEYVDDPVLDDLVAAIEATGQFFDQRVAQMEEELPWRRELVQALPTPAILFASDGYVAAANPPARDLLGIASDGEPTTMLAALGSQALAEGVRRAAGPDPVTIDAEVSGRMVRAVVTRIGRQQLVLVTDRTRERRVENLRRNFVVNASHELKTPVTSIQALAEALLVTVQREPDRLPKLLRRLEEESTRLVRLVHDLLDLRRLEERARVLPNDVDLVPLLVEAVEAVEEWAEERHVTVTVELPPSLAVRADPEDLRLIVRNLVDNGIQYNRDGGSLDITLSAVGGEAVLVVRDHGIGIPKADLPRVFERFYRVDVARSRQTGGTGLGLSLVRNAVSRTGGTIDLDSLLGSGTTFTVRLPALEVPVDAAREPATANRMPTAPDGARATDPAEAGPATVADPFTEDRAVQQGDPVDDDAHVEVD
ncbi:sensor histidine kinase [Salsipaludibacter albus]|uniref:sensor histidine kinase n=1 Tax=Salsipaludibacter albus TaxID=2849650 RepID=UPI002367C989|nr:ATP-binding protein [Salsipaludibacter albus]MBY5162582.1 hypothetical protein [Salsipaludibacter albus]